MDDAQQACPVARAMETIGNKWKAILVWHLLQGPKRFNELRRLIPDITSKVLSQQLQQLVRDGLVERTVGSPSAQSVAYTLSDVGHSLVPVLDVISAWFREHLSRIEAAREQFDRDEADRTSQA